METNQADPNLQAIVKIVSVIKEEVTEEFENVHDNIIVKSEHSMVPDNVAVIIEREYESMDDFKEVKALTSLDDSNLSDVKHEAHDPQNCNKQLSECLACCSKFAERNKSPKPPTQSSQKETKLKKILTEQPRKYLKNKAEVRKSVRLQKEVEARQSHQPQRQAKSLGSEHNRGAKNEVHLAHKGDKRNIDYEKQKKKINKCTESMREKNVENLTASASSVSNLSTADKRDLTSKTMEDKNKILKPQLDITIYDIKIEPSTDMNVIFNENKNINESHDVKNTVQTILLNTKECISKLLPKKRPVIAGTNDSEVTENQSVSTPKKEKRSNELSDNLGPLNKYNTHALKTDLSEDLYNERNENNSFGNVMKANIESDLLEPLNKYFVCDICKHKFTKKHLIVNHMIIHTDEKPFACEICGHKCNYKYNLARHMMTHTGEKPFSCDLCDYKCADKQGLISHKWTHAGKKTFSCNYCSYKCCHKSSLYCHVRIHTGVKPFSCNFCDYKCSYKQSLVKHKKIHTGEKPYSCDLCSYKCAYKSSMVSHLKIHYSKKPFNCQLCDYKCSIKSDLNDHARLHTGELPFACNICSYRSYKKTYLTRHMRIHGGKKRFSCDICNYKCLAKGTLNIHMRNHTGERPFSCDRCSFKCKQKVQLIDHMWTHTGERPYPCKLCEAKFTRKYALINHMRSHTGEKPFACNLCDAKFARKYQLIDHVRTHTGVKPFSCELCPYKSYKRPYLNKHIKIHTAEKPFCCNLCDFKCSHNKVLVSHIRSHTTELCFVKCEPFNHSET